MQRFTIAMKVYLGVMASAATLLLGLTAAGWLQAAPLIRDVAEQPITWRLVPAGLLFATVVAAGMFPLKVATNVKLTVITAPQFAALLLFGVPWGVVLAAGGTLVYQLVLHRLQRRSTTALTLNTAERVISLTLGALVAPPIAAQGVWAYPLAITAMALTIHAANKIIIQAAIACNKRTSVWSLLKGAARRGAREEAVLYLLAVLAALNTPQYPWIPLLVAVPTALVYWVVRASEQARQQSQQALAAAQEREAALRQLADQAQALALRDAEAAAFHELDRLKSEFIRTLSHELRTPLTLVQGFSEVLINQVGDLDPTNVRRLANRINSGSLQLGRLVDDLLDFARIERSEVLVHPVAGDAVPVLADLCAALRRQAGGERIACQLPESLWIHADPVRVTQVVTNLVTNALKYAPDGPIVLAAAQEARIARIEVRDSGPGIPAEEQPRIWQKFYRGTSVAGLNNIPGSGIGLAVVKALVEAQGGQVGLESAPGKGSRFWFTVPLSAVASFSESTATVANQAAQAVSPKLAISA